MNPTILARLIGAMFMAPEGDGGGGGGGEPKPTDPPAVKPEEARAFLAEFGHSADALKTAKDEDVVKQYQTVNANFSKRAEAAAKAKAEAATNAAKEAAKSLKLELPKDSVLSQSDVDEIAATARERGLSKDDAAALLAQREAAIKSYVTRTSDKAKEQRAEWVKTVQNDPQIGGDKFAVTQVNAQRALDHFLPNSKDAEGKDVPHPLRKFLRETGFGDHPDVVRLFNAIGASMADDKGPLNGGRGGAGDGKRDAATVLYGETSP